MDTSGTESCGGRLETQFKHLPPYLALKLSLFPIRMVLYHFNRYLLGLVST